MTTKEAIYLLRNTAWLAPSLEPIDEAINMACEALDKVEYINSQLGKSNDKPQNDCSKCETYWNCQGQCDEIPQIEDEWQIEKEGE